MIRKESTWTSHLRIPCFKVSKRQGRGATDTVQVSAHQEDRSILAANGHVHEVAVKVCEANLCPKTVHDDVDGSIVEQHRVGLLVHLLQKIT